MSQRKAIRDKVVELLIAGGTAVGSRVYGNRVRDIWKTDLPCIVVWTKDEQCEIENVAPLRLKRTMRLVTEIVAKSDDSIDDTMDDIAEAVENILALDPRLLDDDGEALCNDCVLQGTEMDLESGGDTLLGSTKLTWEITHFKDFPVDQTESLDDFELANVKIDVAPPDDQIEIESDVELET